LREEHHTDHRVTRADEPDVSRHPYELGCLISVAERFAERALSRKSVTRKRLVHAGKGLAPIASHYHATHRSRGEHAAQRLGQSTELLEERCGSTRTQSYQSLRLFDRKVAQKDRVDQAEHGGVGSNPERQQHHDHREVSRPTPNDASGLADLAEGIFN
jgi:hypothetical protein